MSALGGLPLLISSVDVALRRASQNANQVLVELNRGRSDTALINALRRSTVEAELLSVGLFSLVEARLQSEFPNGKFFSELKAQLRETSHEDLDDRIQLYYWAINTLKHGKGRSYDCLLGYGDLPFMVKTREEPFFLEGDIAEPEGLINVLDPQFIEGLLATVYEIHEFIFESRGC